jgi:hypothetical protein
MLLAEYTREQFSIERLEDFVSRGHKTYTPNSQLRAIVGLDRSAPVDAQTLAKAKDILDEHFLVAGTTARFDASVLLMKERLDWPIYPFYVRSRTGNPEKKRPIPDHVKEKIRSQNHWDVQLYAYVSKKLDQEIEEQGDAFQRRLDRFQKMNRVFGTLCRYPLSAFRTIREWGKQYDLFSSLR